MSDECSKALAKYGSVRKAADALNIPRSTFFDRLAQERSALEAIRHMQEPRVAPIRGREIKRYIFTCAVKGAPVHADFLENLKAYAAFTGAELIIGALTSTSRQRYAKLEEGKFADEVIPYLSNEPIEIDDKIRYSPELNLTATMSKPLNGLRTYTKRQWAVFPHTKIAAETVPTHKDRPAKWIMTTGAVTHPHYSPTKAGFRAHFDHMHGALIVEVSKDGVWFRHLTPTNEIDGEFYDLGYHISDAEIRPHEGVAGLIYGDIHAEQLDPEVAMATWGYTVDPSLRMKVPTRTLVEELRPYTQVFHDLMDFTAGNYHELQNLFHRLGRWAKGENRVAGDFNKVIKFTRFVATLAEENIVVDSNHDAFIEKWLLKFDPCRMEDFDNIETFYRLKLAVIDMMRAGTKFSLLELAMEHMCGVYDNTEYVTETDEIRFLLSDESYEIMNVECGWHGHFGPNGRRGSKIAFVGVTEKATIGHTHSPAIESGLHVVGTSSKMDLGYNNGPSSWAHTHDIVYPNGNRTLINMSGGKFFADQM